MPRIKIDLRDIRNQPIQDPRVLVRFVNNASGHAEAFDVAFTGAPAILNAPLATGSLYRVEITPSRFSSALRTLMAVSEELDVSARLIHRASEWIPAFTPWAELGAPFTRLQDLLRLSPRFRVGRATLGVRFVEIEYDRIADDESRELAKASLLNMYALLTTERRPGAAGGFWFDGIRELFLATRERIVCRIDAADAALIERIAKGAHGARYKKAPGGLHVDNFEEIAGFDFRKQDIVSVKTKDKFGNLQLTVARGGLEGADVAILDADCDENGVEFAHLLDLPKHAVTGGTNPIEIHDILVNRDPLRDLGYLLVPKPSREDRMAAHVEARIVEFRAIEVAAGLREVAVIGDSVTWGQGLKDGQKLHNIVRGVLGADLPPARMLAHSGAVIGAGIPPAFSEIVHPEVPRGRPTILEQAELLPDPGSIDLLILNGGINDLDIRYILNPRTSVQELADDTRRVCGVDMAALLDVVCRRVTKAAARIVVLSYYPILSQDSDPIGRAEFFDRLAIPRPAPPDPPAIDVAFWSRILENCATFYAVSTEATRDAIDQVNGGVGAGRVRFAAPPFRPENAALASSPWLFGLTGVFGPEDPMKDERRIACDRFETDIFRRQQCYRASAGHPNPRGAVEYAGAVIAALA